MENFLLFTTVSKLPPHQTIRIGVKLSRTLSLHIRVTREEKKKKGRRRGEEERRTGGKERRKRERRKE